MTSKLVEKLNELRAVLEQEMPKETTSVSIYVTYDGTDVSTSMKTPDDLKREGASMRNIKGEWIK